MDELIAKVAPYTKSTPQRVRAMINALSDIEVRGIPGDVVECGVWRAGNIMLARELTPSRVCWLYDTFEGMTEPGPEDLKRGGKKSAHTIWKRKVGKANSWEKISLENVKAGFREWGLSDEENLRFVAGPVEETLLRPENLPDRVALLRLDTDWYASTKIELEVLYPRLEPGGVMIVDDYGHWLGARKAVDDYLGLRAGLLEFIDYTGVMMVKP